MDKNDKKMTVVGVRFVSGVKVYYFAPGEVDYHKGDYVIVESQNGHELAKVVYGRRELNKSELGEELLLNYIRVATSEDKKSVLEFHEVRKEYIKKATELANQLKLPVKFLDVTRSLDESKRLLFLFAADGRIDFRELILMMSKQFQSPIRLYQVGPRDAARIVGGIGICGQKICCSRFLNKFESITMEIARDQDLANMGSGKISGVCGKLL
ncbi:MAG TPA: regulatory iron-sulfur-containing complex subunit RicT, partial [bacterium]|nr:regulatory iron-sulfur-containing complex subunit RicT [bacterium]